MNILVLVTSLWTATSHSYEKKNSRKMAGHMPLETWTGKSHQVSNQGIGSHNVNKNGKYCIEILTMFALTDHINS